MAKEDIFRAIAIILGLMLLRLIFILDESHIIVYTVGGVVILIKLFQYAQTKDSSKAIIKHEPKQKHAALIPMEHDGKTYVYLEDMPPTVRQNYDNFIATINKAHPDGLEMLLSKINRAELLNSLREIEELKATGLIGEEEFEAAKRQLLTYGE